MQHAPTILCHISEFDQRASKGFTLGENKVFVVRENDEFFAYKNSCPHQHIPLDWDNDQFLDFDGELIQCATHGALFVIHTGKCVSGPCVGANLQKLDIKIENDIIFLLGDT